MRAVAGLRRRVSTWRPGRRVRRRSQRAISKGDLKGSSLLVIWMRFGGRRSRAREHLRPRTRRFVLWGRGQSGRGKDRGRARSERATVGRPGDVAHRSDHMCPARARGAGNDAAVIRDGVGVCSCCGVNLFLPKMRVLSSSHTAAGGKSQDPPRPARRPRTQLDRRRSGGCAESPRGDRGTRSPHQAHQDGQPRRPAASATSHMRYRHGPCALPPRSYRPRRRRSGGQCSMITYSVLLLKKPHLKGLLQMPHRLRRVSVR